MQLLVTHELKEELVLPLNYHHILQAIIYKGLEGSDEFHREHFNDFLHDKGFSNGKRSYKLFTFSLLQGKYEIEGRKIVFRDKVSFEVRSPDSLVIQRLAGGFAKNGIQYGDVHVSDVKTVLKDRTVENDVVPVEMITPVCVYSTDMETKKTYFYDPSEPEFGEAINDNFIRKYTAFYGIEPESDVVIEPVRITQKDKFVTNYKGFYISGWKGVYRLYGERKYLDFLYQAGLGSRNSQGFGMFRLL